VPQKDLSLTAQMIHLEGAVLKVPQGKVLLEALQELWIESAKVIEHLAPSYYQAKGKIHEVGGWQEKFSSSLIEALGVTLKAPKITGHYPQASCSIQYDTLSNTLTHPISQQELYDIIVGQVSKGNAGLAMVAALAVGLASMGTATPAVMAAFFGELGGMIASAMVASIASQTASSLVMHQGNIKQVGKDLTSSSFARSLVVTAATAGIMHKLSGTLNLPTQPKGFEQHLQVSMVRAAVSTPLNIFIGGSKPGEALLSAARMIAAGTLGGLGANEIAQVYSDGQLDYLTHKLAHALLGAGMGSILSEDVARGMLSGAVGGFFGEVTGEELVEQLGDKRLTTVLGQMDATVMKAQLAAAIATVLIGQDVGVATFVAENAIRNNSYLRSLILTIKAGEQVVKAGAKVLLKKESKGAAKVVIKEASKESAKQAVTKGAEKATRIITKEAKKVVKTPGKTTPKNLAIEGLDLATPKPKGTYSGLKVKKGEQPWTIRPGQEWKEKIIGRAQKTGTTGHDVRSYRIAIREAKKAETDAVLLNRGMKRATGEPIAPNNRPDVTVVRKNGKVDQFEVPSSTDKIRTLRERMDKATTQVSKEQRGDNKIIDIVIKDLKGE
jgi:hypothetical protein